MDLFLSLIRVLLLHISIPLVQSFLLRSYYTSIVGTSMHLVVAFLSSENVWCLPLVLCFSCCFMAAFSSLSVNGLLYGWLFCFSSLCISLAHLSWVDLLKSLHVVCKDFHNFVMLGNHLSSFLQWGHYYGFLISI